MHCKSKRRARLTEQPRSIHHAKSPFSIHFNDYITENCSVHVCYHRMIAERFKAVIWVTSTFVRKRSNPDYDKRFLFFLLFFLSFFLNVKIGGAAYTALRPYRRQIRYRENNKILLRYPLVYVLKCSLSKRGHHTVFFVCDFQLIEKFSHFSLVINRQLLRFSVMFFLFIYFFISDIYTGWHISPIWWSSMRPCLVIIQQITASKTKYLNTQAYKQVKYKLIGIPLK